MSEDLSKPKKNDDSSIPNIGYRPPIFLRADKEGVIDLSELLHQQYPSKPVEPPCPDNFAWEYVAEVLIEELNQNLSRIEERSNSEFIHRLGMKKMLAATKEIAKRLANCRVGNVTTGYFHSKYDQALEEFEMAEEQWNKGIRGL